MADSMAIASSALSAYGLRQATTANNVANINTPDYKAASVQLKENKAGGVQATVVTGNDRVDISREATEMVSTKNSFKANLKVMRVADQMSKELLNIKA
jgi:flagellar hook protein FlgE